MSSYMVENETINKIVCSLEHGTQWGDSCRYPSFKYDDYRWLQERVRNREAREKFVKELATMNAEAVYERYGDKADLIIPETEVYHYGFVPASSPLKFYKSLQCYLYQCAEGNVPETFLYKKLEEIKDVLAHHIVGSLPEYEKAPWG